MKIVTIDQVEPEETPEVALRYLFRSDISEKTKFSFGVITIPPGVRIPSEGAGLHEGDEFSIIVKGEILTGNNKSKHRVNCGQAVFIPAGEPHWALNDSASDCEIVWVLLDP